MWRIWEGAEGLYEHVDREKDCNFLSLRRKHEQLQTWYQYSCCWPQIGLHKNVRQQSVMGQEAPHHTLPLLGELLSTDGF